MNIKPNLGGTKAFTLMEVILAMTIIGITAAGLMGCFTGSFFIMRMARENQRATQVLMERAEAIRAFSWQDITNGNLPSTFTDYFNPNLTNDSKGVVYNGTVGITNVPFTTTYSSNHMLQINLSVSWTTEGVRRSRNLATFISYDGIENYVY